MAENRFGGKGIHFPVQVDRATGRIRMSEETTSIKESIYLILMTQKTERWLRPDFGSRLNSYTFLSPSVTMLHIMARELKEDILSQEPRISDVTVQMDPERRPGCLIVTIAYTVSDVDTRGNLVFPFSLNETEKGDEMDENATI